MGRRSANLIVSVVQTVWPWAMDMWEGWGIQFLVLASLGFQIILVVFGGRRRYNPKLITRLITWASFLLGSYIATFALGKLSVVNIRDPMNPDYNVGLRGLLAPLLLIHLANPDCMNAYSNEDTELGRRQALSLLLSVVIVFWILVRCWDMSSPVSWLYIPLGMAGIIKPLGTCWALYLIHDDTTSASEIREVTEKMQQGSHDDINSIPPGFLKYILIAYKRFDCLKPHRVNWVYHPSYMAPSWSINLSKPEEEFIITEIELGFVYDMIYTKSPILYTKIGVAGKAILSLCLVSTLCGFSIMFRNAFLLDLYVTYTYALLIESCIVELYEICILPFSTWGVVKIHRKLNQKVLNFVVGACEKQKRWSNSLPQLNIERYFLKHDFPKPVTFILQKLNQEEWLKGQWSTTRTTIDSKFKREVLIRMKVLLEHKGDMKPYTNRGLWSLEIFNIPEDSSDKYFVKDKEFGKSIIIWHIATEVLRSSTIPLECSSYSVSGLLSNYMMNLLVCRPFMLSLTTSGITFRYASARLKAFAASKGIPCYKGSLLLNEVRQENFENDEKDANYLTDDWEVLNEAHQLVTRLNVVKPNDEEAKWKLICSVWVEMLCYAAYHCPHNHHTTALRGGGELITHVWLLLAHQTDKFPSEESEWQKYISKSHA